MRILVVNKFWYRRGGLERVMFDEVDWLQAAGHEIAHFSMAHPLNQDSPWSSYFVPYLELEEAGNLNLSAKLCAAVRLFHNSVAVRQFSSLVDEFRPDVVHAHGIHRQISTSILAVAHKRHIPVVHSLHDYHLLCPADVLLHSGSEPCQPPRCRTLRYGSCIRGRCVRGSLLASSLSAAEVAWAHTRRAYTTGRNVFICPSEFMRHQMIRAGWRVSMHVVHNALPVEPGPPSPGESFLVVGRLSPEKGVDIAADAARIAGVPLIVAGDGPLLDDLRKQYPDVVFTGHLSPTEVRSLVRTARGVVVPSLALENAPMSVLEAMACGTPVVASNIGGIPEQIQHGYSGMLVPPGDVASLAKAMELLTGDRAFAYSLGSHAKKVVSDRFSPHFHLAGLERAYSTVVSGDK